MSKVHSYFDIDGKLIRCKAKEASKKHLFKSRREALQTKEQLEWDIQRAEMERDHNIVLKQIDKIFGSEQA